MNELRINIQEELSAAKIDWKYVSGGQDWIEVNCPFHADNKPSCHINVEKQTFNCKACSEHGGVLKLIAKVYKCTIGTLYKELGPKYVTNTDKVVDPHNIERYYADLDETFRAELHSRCITDDLIRAYRIGKLDNRIAIPIKNPAGYYINVRLHKPYAKEKKVISLRGFGKGVRLFPVEQLEYNTIVLTGGELKAIAGIPICNANDIGVITTTGGESAWDATLTNYFHNKKVYIVYDIDEAGIKGAQKIAKILYAVTSWIGIVQLPLDPTKYPKGDLNNFLAEKGNLLEVLDKTPKWEYILDSPNEKYSEAEKSLVIPFTEAYSSKYLGQRIKFKAIISAMGRASYSIPKVVEVKCARDTNFCQTCPVMLKCKPDEQIISLGRENPHLLSMINTNTTSLNAAVREAIGIPSRCKSHTVNVRASYDVEDCRLSPELEITNTSIDRSMQSAYCHVGESLLEMNESYYFEGRMFAHPANQTATVLISNETLAQDALSSYELKDIEKLKLFQPEEWTLESLTEKLNEIYADLAANVTLIHQRQSLHTVMDLAYHSPLFITFDRNSNLKGWVEVLIVGDTSQGKSQVAAKLRDHYALGESVECKGITEAGLKGGLQQLGTKEWYVTWGVIPTNDKGLVILEELKGAREGVFNKLTFMRYSGVAEITKIEKRKTHARTRLIVISNPKKDGNNISNYNFGVEALVELISGLEDLRRFDVCLVLDRNEVDAGKLQALRPDIEHKYKSNLCRELILWSWTRTGSQVTFENEQLLLDMTTKLCDKYCDDIPLVDRGSAREKIARLSAALAARTFSTGEDTDSILVRNCHVAYAILLLDNIYSSKYCGYAEISHMIKEAEKIVEPEKIKKRIQNDIPYARDFVTLLLEQEVIDVFFIQDVIGWDATEARNLLSFLIRSRAIRKEGRYYRKTSSFTELLKFMVGEEELKNMPDHIDRDD